MSDSKTSTEVARRVPPPVTELARHIAAEGGRAYLVGGSVRDALLDRPSKDLDVEVFGLTVDALEVLLRQRGHVNAVGKSFGVLKWRPRRARDVGEVDVSIPRRDSKTGPGHTGISVEGDPDMTVEEAVHRRDLTINAIMFDLVDQSIVDPSAGLADLEVERLRAVDESTFLEDPLRALRVVQFAARLGFRPDAPLCDLCQRAALDELPAERIQGEWRKLLLKGRDITLGLQLAHDTHVLRRVFPEWPSPDGGPLLDRLVAPRDALAGQEGPKAEGRAWALMLTGWLAGASSEVVTAVLDRLWLHRVGNYPLRDRVLAAVAHLDDPLASDADLRHLSTRAEVETIALVRAGQGDQGATEALERATQLGILHERPAPLLQGRDLKKVMPPGPRMGQILAGVYEAQLDGTITTQDEALALAESLLKP